MLRCKGKVIYVVYKLFKIYLIDNEYVECSVIVFYGGIV